MKVLVIGNGGREHALAWKAAQSPLVEHVFVAPGNPGTATENKISNVEIGPCDLDKLVAFATAEKIDLTIVGPEAPLVIGVVDAFRAAGLKIFGPTKKAAQLEGSKSFTKDFLARHNIPTAHYAVFTDTDQALAYLDKVGAPIVIKADGLAAGKGVIVAMTMEEARHAVTDMLSDNKFGSAGSRVVIEEFLTGEEASFIVMVDGDNVVPMATSQDHKRVGDGDQGPNTGGMGAYSPAPVVTDEVYAKVMEQVILPTVNGMKAEGNPYTGFLYAGLMIDANGDPKVIEYNCRFGDPETQVVLLLLETDLLEAMMATASGNLDKCKIKFANKAACCVIMASKGYPEKYESGYEIKIAPEVFDSVYVAGARLDGERLVNAGGRVLGVTAVADTLGEAIEAAYKKVEKVTFDNAYYRRDIGQRAMKALKE